MLNLNLFSSEHSNTSLNAVGHASLQGPSSPEPSMLAATSVSPQVLLCQARSHFALGVFHLQMHIHVKKCILVRKGFHNRNWKCSDNWTNGPVSQVCWSPLCSKQFPGCALPGEGAALSPQPVFTPQKLHPCGAPAPSLGQPELLSRAELPQGRQAQEPVPMSAAVPQAIR